MRKNNSRVWDKIKSRWLLMLFGLPFAGVGVGMLLMMVLPTLLEARQMQHWHEGQAQLTRAGVEVRRGDDSTTYLAYADYRYTYQDKNYTGSRVAINGSADNLGDFQQQLGWRLERAYEEGRPVAVYINPGNPAQAVLNRELRWGLLGFSMVFVLVFGGVGLGILLYAFMAPLDKLDSAEGDSKPWLTRRDWASPEIKCNGKALLWASWGFAIFWNLIAIPTGVQSVLEVVHKDNTAALAGLLFPLVGAGLLAWAIKELRAYRRFGPAPLRMDPYPGGIGGQVGGVIEVNLPYDRAVEFPVALACLEIYYTGSGKNRKRQERLVWQGEGYAATRPTGIGGNKTRLEILFDVPANLPQSEPPSSRYHLWRLSVRAELPGADFNRRYELPVFATAGRAQYLDQASDGNPIQQQASEAAIEEVLDIRQIAGGVELDNPPWRRPGAKITGILVGAVFTGVGVVMLNQQAPLLFTLLMLAIGVTALLGSLYSLVLRLWVRLDAAALQVRKSLLGLAIGNHHVDRADIAALVLKKSYSSSTGDRYTEFFLIQVLTRDGSRITIARNLAGRGAAQQALESISMLTGIPHR